jgi:hypothetical protein
MVPLITCPGGKPVTALPGLTPRSPEMIEGPVLVTVEPANTAKDVAVPSPTGAWAADAVHLPESAPKIVKAAAVTTANATANRRFRQPAKGQRSTNFMNVPYQ